jgi:2,3,4,5-tetrahydropyridine-2-carboxylate N-succinyltransferase/tetrahydrodipicolinate N-acetyltransferase
MVTANAPMKQRAYRNNQPPNSKKGIIMEATEIIQLIKDAKKKTPVKVFLKEKKEIRFENCKVFGVGDKIVFGDWGDVKGALEAQSADIEDLVIESDCRNSAIPLLDTKDVGARIEPGAVIRDRAEIGDGAVVMMGAVINIGAVVGAGTMIDMGAILGGRATVGQNCHIGAGAVLAGVIEPPSAKPVVVEDGVLVGANAVVLEGVRIGRGAVVAAGAVVIEDVPAETVVAGIPARVVKSVKDTAEAKIAIVQALREL